MLDFIIRAVVCFFIVGVISRNAFRGTYLPAFKKDIIFFTVLLVLSYIVF